MRYEQKIYIEKELQDKIFKHLNTEPTCADECLGENDTIKVTAKFHRGIEMDIKCCGVKYDTNADTNTAWTEAVLYQDERQLCCTDPDDEFMGEWILVYEGDEYAVIVEPISKKIVYEVDLRDRTTGESVECILSTEDNSEAWDYAEQWNRKNVPDYNEDTNYDSYIDGTEGLVADVYEVNFEDAKGVGKLTPVKKLVVDTTRQPTLENYIARYKMHKAHLEKHPEYELMLRRKIREAEEAILKIVTGDDFLKDMERANLYKYM